MSTSSRRNSKYNLGLPSIQVHISLIILIYSSASWLIDYLHDVFLGTYSGRKLTRLGRSVAWSFFMSLAFSLQDSRVSDLRFFRGFRCFNPPAVIRELETFRDTKSVNPVNCNYVDIRLLDRHWREIEEQMFAKNDGNTKVVETNFKFLVVWNFKVLKNFNHIFK